MPRFLAAFERTHAPARDRVGALLAIPAAHHRVLWIHPFLDGRGNLSAEALASFTEFFLRACLEEAGSMDPSAVLDETRAAGRAQAGPDPAAGRLLHGTADEIQEFPGSG